MSAVSFTEQRSSRPNSTGAWPIISRELGAEARNRANHWLRLLGAAWLTVLYVAMLSDENRASAALSMTLFTSAHSLLLLAIFSVGPALTSDAISRERREGTLCLLFSTPLNERAIVLGKSFVHSVRLLTLWCAALPLLMIPVLLGGVTGLDILSALVLEACAVFWALGAGMVASAFLKHPILAVLVAEAFCVALLLLVCGILEAAFLFQLNPLLTGPTPITRHQYLDVGWSLLSGLLSEGGWSGKLRSVGTTGHHLWIAVLAEMLLISLLGFITLLMIAAGRTRAVWQERPPSPRQWQRRQTWLVPRFWLGLFSQQRRRWLDRNPLSWAHQHSTWGRLQKLGWCGLILLVESLVMLSPRPWEYQFRAQTLLAIGLALQMTFAAVMVFRAERDSGVLELLLITPMTVHQIVFKQLCSFWRRFLPPVLLLIFLAELMIWLDLSNQACFNFQSFLLVNVLTIPLIGFYSSAQFQNFTAAFFCAAFFSLGLPLFAPELSPGFLERIAGLEIWWLNQWAPMPESDGLDLTIKAAQIGAALLFGFWACQNLANRTFFLRRSS